MRLLVILAVVCFCVAVNAQQPVVLQGVIKDRSNNEAVEFVSVIIANTNTVVSSDSSGHYEISFQQNNETVIQFRRTGYKPWDYTLPLQQPGTRFELNVSLAPSNTDMEVIVTAQRIEDAGMVHEKVEPFKMLPSTTGNLESILPHIALGTSSGTGGELTSQYNVRGGNYDENLVYVNDFEIYRPLLIHSGNQEGLTLPNFDLIRDLSFSSGGFEAKYGDKMSSVLDVRYKLPDTMRASFSISFLGASGHLEGSVPLGKDS